MEAASDTALVPPPAVGPEKWGHPRGLWTLNGTELWDRISFHGMVAMLVLYMTGDLLQPDRMEHILGFAAYRQFLEWVFGAVTPAAIATQTFGLYYAVLTCLPLVGGWLGDKFVSRKFAVTTGALTMTAGHFAMAFDRTFLIALALLVTGAGLLRGNLKSQIRALYRAGDRRLADAFQLYSMVVNFGAFVAPIVSGAVAKYYGWHAGFAVAGIGMLIGLAWYLIGSASLPPDPPKGMHIHRAPLTRDQRRDVLGLFVMWPVSLGFWTAQAQIWNVYNLWLRDHVQMTVGGFAVPVPWLQALDGLAPAAYVPVVILLWRWQARRGTEPDLYTKMGVGCVVFAASTLLLAGAPLLAGADGLAPLWIPVLFHVASNWGGAYFSPVMETFYAARAPEQWRGSLLGIDALSVSAASILSGTMGSWYETVSPPVFWLATAAIAAAAGVYVLALRGMMRRWLGDEVDDPEVRVEASFVRSRPASSPSSARP